MKIRFNPILFAGFAGIFLSNVSSAAQPAFSSRTDSPYVLYIDYDGEDETDSVEWNPIVAAPSELSDFEIEESWAITAEAFKSFNVNVTTDRDVYDSTAVTQRQKCIVTTTSERSQTSVSAVAGLARSNSFGQDIPCWSFNPSSYIIPAHEFGHTLGLSHDGIGSPFEHTDFDEEYHDGQSGWVPTMGLSSTLNRQLFQWSKGEYFQSNTIRDDIEIIAERFGFVSDDAGDSISQATSIVFSRSPETGFTAEVEGQISTELDSDFYRIDVPAGSYQLNVSIEPFYISGVRGVLPIEITWYNESGQVIYEDTADQREYVNAEGGHRSFLELESLTAETFFVSIKGSEVVPAGNTRYGSIGTYSISIDSDSLHIEAGTADFSDVFTSPSVLTFTQGKNQIRGQINETDSDYITFTVPLGYHIGSIIIDESSSTASSLTLAHRFGSGFSRSGIAGGLDGVSTIYNNSSEQYANFTNLGVGQHAFLISSDEGSDITEDYSLSFDITPAIVTEYDESIHGDLSEVADTPTNLGTLNKSVTIRGEVGINGDNPNESSFELGDTDFFTLTVPEGFTLGVVPVSVTEQTGIISSRGIGMPEFSKGAYVEEFISSARELRYQNYTPGTYTFFIQSADQGLVSHYEFSFTLIPVAQGWAGQDIGDVSAEGALSVDSNGQIILSASGSDIYGNADEFHYAYLPLIGDGEITAQVTSLTNTNAWAKAGVMIRETLDADSVNTMTLVSASRGITSQSRSTRGNRTSFSKGSASAASPHWVRLNRTGDVFTSSQSSNGVTWTAFKTWTVPMAQSVHIGLATTSHQDGILTTAIFDNVSISETDVSDVGVEIDATEYSQESAPENERVIRNMGTKVGFIANNSWVSYESFDFGSLGVTSVDVLASSGSRGGTIELRLGSSTGVLVGSIQVTNTGGWENFTTFTGSISAPVNGLQDVYFVFVGQSSGLMDLQTFQINK